jgi:hypothetical protein
MIRGVVLLRDAVIKNVVQDSIGSHAASSRGSELLFPFSLDARREETISSIAYRSSVSF